MLLEIRNVSKTYTGRSEPVPALDNLSLALGVGEFVAVRGESGCGKTTLLLTAGGLLVPDRGEILIAGGNPYALHSRPSGGAARRSARFCLSAISSGALPECVGKRADRGHGEPIAPSRVNGPKPAQGLGSCSIGWAFRTGQIMCQGS